MVESPRGATVKFKYDPAARVMTLSRPIPLGLAYPFDWGFIRATRADGRIAVTREPPAGFLTLTSGPAVSPAAFRSRIVKWRGAASILGVRVRSRLEKDSGNRHPKA